MATQGLVTVRAKSDGKVVMKIVAGCDGYNASRLANCLRGTSWPIDINTVYDWAREFGFGDRECLVVITETEARFDGDDDLGSLYRETFDQPFFNPRWKEGVADHIEIVYV